MYESTMSVIIRLQNLPWSANALDVRGYFIGLSIPDGGVHIVGGENGDAFIAFSTDEDARQAMMLDGGKIKEVQVHLLLSSRAEMQKVIETARQTTISYMQIPITQVQSQPPQQAAPVQTQNSAMSPSLSGILSQQMLQQQKNLITDLTLSNVSKLSTIPHHITINDNSSDSKDSRISLSKDSSDFKNDRDKKRDSDRRDRDRDRKLSRSRSRSGSRSRDRRRSRSYERGSRNSRRRRSRSRDRDRRNKRSRRSKSRDRSRDRERDRDRRSSKDTIINLTNTNETSNVSQPNKSISIWDTTSSSTNTNSNSPNINHAASTLNVYNSTATGAAPTTIKRMYSTEELNKLHQLDKMRNSSAFQTGQEPLFSTNMQFDRRPTTQQMPIIGPVIPQQNLPYIINTLTSQPPPPFISQVEEGKCIKISNMHLITGYGEIRRFFQGLQINQNGIKMINDKFGRRTGTALVRFIRNESKKSALSKTDTVLRGEVVNISDIPNEDFENAIDSFKPTNYNSNRNYKYTDTDNESDEEDDDDDVQIVSVESTPKPYVEPLPFQTLMVDGIPPFTKEHDILKMFSNYSLMHIVLGKSKSGSKPLKGFVKFHRPDDAKAALNDKSLHFIAHKNVVVSVCSNDIYEAAKNEFSSDSEFMDKVITPPVNTTTNSSFPSDPRQNKSNYLSGEKSNKDYNSESNDNNNWNNATYNTNNNNENNDSTVSRNGSLDPRINNNRLNDFRNNRTNNDNNSFQSNNNWSNDSNYQNNFRAREQGNSNDEQQNVPQQWNKDPRYRGGNNNHHQMDSVNTDCVAISNLELKTTDRDVIDFFSDIGLIPLRVHILLTTQGEPSGDCFCEFGSPEDAARAVAKNNTHLGLNSVSVEYIPRQKVEEILLSFKNSQTGSGHNNNNNKHGRGGDDYSGYRNRGGDYRNNNGNNNNYNRQQNNNNNHMGRGPPQMQMNLNMNPNVRPLLGNNYQDINPMMDMNMPQPVVGDFGAPGCVLSLENVPYRAGVDDILEFFSEFNLNKQHVMRRYNNHGAPTGDARVCFESPADAMRALDTKRLGKIANRTIYLNILQDN